MENETTRNGTAPKVVAMEIAKPATRTAMLKAYEPQNFTEAMKIAETLAKSRMFGVTNPESAFVIMSTGADLGLSPTAALRSIFTVNGRAGLSADLMVALCVQSEDCEYFRCIESTSERATYAAKRRGDPERRHTWTIEQAKRAGLAGKDVWKAYPEDMLRHRAAAPLARELFPHLLLGMYCREELEEIVAHEEAPKPQEVLDADVVQAPAHDDSLTRLTAMYVQAATMDEVKAIREEVSKLGLEKGSDDYAAMRQLDKEAVERIKGVQ